MDSVLNHSATTWWYTSSLPHNAANICLVYHAHVYYTVGWLAFEDTNFEDFYRTLKIFILEIVRLYSSTAYYLFIIENIFTKYSIY